MTTELDPALLTTPFVLLDGSAEEAVSASGMTTFRIDGSASKNLEAMLGEFARFLSFRRTSGTTRTPSATWSAICRGSTTLRDS